MNTGRTSKEWQRHEHRDDLHLTTAVNTLEPTRQLQSLGLFTMAETLYTCSYQLEILTCFAELKSDGSLQITASCPTLLNKHKHVCQDGVRYFSGTDGLPSKGGALATVHESLSSG